MYMFGLGPGWGSLKVRRIAKRLGAELVNHTDAECNCGYGCHPHSCKKSRRHWFELPNHGSAEDQRLANEVLRTIEEALRKPK